MQGAWGATRAVIGRSMEATEIRPTFTLYVGVAAAQALGCLQAHLGSEACKADGWIKVPYAELRMPDEKSRFWSPRLAIYVEDTAGGSHLMCRLGPKPDVWTMYVAMYAVCGIGFLIAGAVAYSKVTLGEPALSWWLGTGGAALLGALLYGSAFVGQRLARDDWHHLHDELWDAFRRYDIDVVPVESLPSL